MILRGIMIRSIVKNPFRNVSKLLLLLALMSMLVFQSACSGTKMNKIAKDYLIQSGISKSRLTKCDYKGIEGIGSPIKNADLSDVSSFIGEFLLRYYVLNERGDTEPVAENDLIRLQAFIKDGEETFFTSDELLIVAAENGEAFPGLQSGIIGKPVGFSGTYIIPETDALKTTGSAGKVLSYTIADIQTCALKSDLLEASLKAQGIGSPAAFYDYLFDLHTGELWEVAKYTARQELISAALAKCRFQYSADEVEAYAERLLQSHQKAAGEVGMSFDEYWKWACENVVGLPLSEDPYLDAVEKAKREIGEIFLVGTMAERLKIDLSEEDPGVLDQAPDGISDEEKTELLFFVLEDRVIEALNPSLTESRLSGTAFWEKPGTESNEKETDDITAAVAHFGMGEGPIIKEDAARIKEYLNAHPYGALRKGISGLYTLNWDFYIALVDPEDSAVLAELEEIGLQSHYILTKGEHSYYRMVELEKMLRNSIKVLQAACLYGTADEKMIRLNQYQPAVSSYDPLTGELCVSITGKFSWNEEEFEKERREITELFEEVIGKHSGVTLMFSV